MVYCNCKNGSGGYAHKCKDCNPICENDGSLDSCIDNKTLGMATDVFITLLVLSYVFFLVLLYYVMQTIKKCNGNPPWLTPTLTTLVILILILGWVPFINIILVIALITITMQYYVVCKGGKKKSRGK